MRLEDILAIQSWLVVPAGSWGACSTSSEKTRFKREVGGRWSMAKGARIELAKTFTPESLEWSV